MAIPLEARFSNYISTAKLIYFIFVIDLFFFNFKIEKFLSFYFLIDKQRF